MKKKYYIGIFLAALISVLLASLYVYRPSNDDIMEEIDKGLKDYNHQRKMSNGLESDESDSLRNKQIGPGIKKLRVAQSFVSRIEDFKENIQISTSDSLYELQASELQLESLPVECQEIVDNYFKSRLKNSLEVDSLLSSIDELEEEVLRCILYEME